MDSRYFSFNIGPKKVYLLYEGQGNGSQFFLTVSSLRSLHSLETQENFMFGLFFGLVITMIAYNFFILLSNEKYELPLLCHLCYLFGLSMGIIMGFTQRFLFQDIPWFSNNGFFFLVSCTVVSILLFTTSLLKLREFTPKFYKIMRFYVILGVVAIFSSLILPLTVNFFFGGDKCPFHSLSPYFCWNLPSQDEIPTANYFMLAFTLFLGVIIWVLAIVGALPSNFFKAWDYFWKCFSNDSPFHGLADRFNLIQEESLKKEEEHAQTLQIEVERQTQQIKKSLSDISGLLNGLKQAVFAIDNQGLIIPPFLISVRKSLKKM